MNQELIRHPDIQEGQLLEQPPQSFEDCTFFTIRHGDAQYQMNEGIVAGEHPETPFFPEDQNFTSDLSPQGKEKARLEAQEFLSHFDKDKDVLYFAASDLVRARETGYIFLTVAKEKGFEIIDAPQSAPKRLSPNIRQGLGGDQIRTLDSLSLNINNMLVEFVFDPHNYLSPREEESQHVFFPDNVSKATKELWVEARKIIENDDKGTWGKNFLAHSAAMDQLFSKFAQDHPDMIVPRITTAQDMYANRFKAMLQEMKTVKDVISSHESQSDKKVRVLAFTHENSLLYFLDKEFGKQEIEKLEAVGYQVLPDDKGSYHYYAAIKEGADSKVKEISLPTKEQ